MTALGDYVFDAFRYVRSAGVSDVADILLMAFILYQIMRAVRNTSFMEVARGILILAVAMWLSVLLKLNVLNFILRWVFQLGLISLVIIFQPELRRLLERVGAGWFRAIFRGEETGIVETAIVGTVSACADMKRDKTGALIIFERGSSLDTVSATGTALNAVLTPELLKNIFFPKAPLHDGAVIVRRDGTVSAAGCMLPLSTNKNLSRDLGMRHRAGIGISEQTDAVVVIVSEETGAVSVAVDGALKRRLTSEVFEQTLRELLIKEEEGKGGYGLMDSLTSRFRVDR